MTVERRFGEWIFDPDTGDLTLNGETNRLEPTVSRLLDYLLSNQSRLVSREELIEHVWFNRIVSGDPINRCISILRQALNPNDKQAYIETVPRKGYRAAFPPFIQLPKDNPPYTLGKIKPLLIGVCLTLLVVFILTYQWNESSGPDQITPSIAVLPFNYLSQDDSNEYLAEGISDTVIHLLSRVKELDVTARTSSFSFRNKELTLGEIASQLGVNHVLEGSVQTSNGNIRVLTRLVSAETEKEIWSQNFDKKITELFDIQDDIAQAVVAALKGTILLKEQLDYQPAQEAYQLVVKGRREFDKMTSSGFAKAESLFRRAMLVDPGYALPQALLARTLKKQIDSDSVAHIYPSVRQSSLEEEIDGLLESAVQLDPLLSEAYELKGMMLWGNGRLQEAATALLRAIELEPNNAEALGDYAAWLQIEGHLDQAVVYARRAVALDPRSSRLQQVLARNLWSVGRSEEAIGVIEDNIRDNPGSANNYSLLSRWSLQLGQPGNAMLYAIKERALDPDNPNRQWGVCLMYMQIWEYDSAANCSSELLSRFPDYYEAKKHALEAQSRIEEMIPLIEKQIALFPTEPYYRLQLADILVPLNRGEEAKALLLPVYPKLFADSPQVDDWSIWGAQILVRAYLQGNNSKSAEKLIAIALNHTDRSRKMQGGGFSRGTDDVYFLVLKGDLEEALKRLSTAIEDNWSMYSMYFDYDPVFAPIAEDPRFKALVEKHKHFMLSEQHWYQSELARTSKLSATP